MNLRPLTSMLLASAFTIASVGCGTAPGKPKPGLAAEAIRPDQVTDFNTLYSQNCAACHGAHGRNGAAIGLANPLYLAFAGTQNLQHVTAAGVPGTMMPGFAKSAGGMLTDQQIEILTKGMIQTWGNAALMTGQSLPPYAGKQGADPEQGQKAFVAHCASCHGPDGNGSSSNTSAGKAGPGSIVEPAYLSLISDQGLRSMIVAGRQPEQNTARQSTPERSTTDGGMPDYRSYPGQALSNEEITNIVAWLASHRTATPGQIYRQHP